MSETVDVLFLGGSADQQVHAIPAEDGRPPATYHSTILHFDGDVVLHTHEPTSRLLTSTYHPVPNPEPDGPRWLMILQGHALFHGGPFRHCLIDVWPHEIPPPPPNPAARKFEQIEL